MMNATLNLPSNLPLEIKLVVEPKSGQDDKTSIHDTISCFADYGVAINSGVYSGMETAECKARITTDLNQSGLGCEAVNYKLRDWLFSRQRFWGEPFPFCWSWVDDGRPNGRVRVCPVESLPVDLPHLEDYKPHGKPEPPLGKADASWLYVELDGKRYRRETNTMPQWAGSCWYYLRFIDPRNDKALIDPAKEKAWMPVDLYVGGAEHAVLHLLYARFWHKVLYDRGYVSTVEPFQKLINQGMILGEVEHHAMKTSCGNWVSYNEAIESDDGTFSDPATKEKCSVVKVIEDDVMKAGDVFVLKADPRIRVDSRAEDVESSRQCGEPRRYCQRVWSRFAPPL
jgi:leucyl-tRNA synthetase